MPKPQWGWFVVGVLAMLTGIWLVGSGISAPAVGNAPPGLLVGLVALLTVWSFGKAFFNFRIPPRDRG